MGIHLWQILQTGGIHSTLGLGQPKTPHSPTISGMQPQSSPRSVVLTQPQIVAGATGPAPSVRPKKPTRPGGSAFNSSSNTKFSTNGRPRPLLPTPRPQQPLLPTPHPRPPSNYTSRAGQPQKFSMILTNRFIALKDLYSETPTSEQA